MSNYESNLSTYWALLITVANSVRAQRGFNIIYATQVCPRGSIHRFQTEGHKDKKNPFGIVGSAFEAVGDTSTIITLQQREPKLHEMM